MSPTILPFLGITMSWSHDIPLVWEHVFPPFPDGAVVAVKFKCGKCNNVLQAKRVKIPEPPLVGDAGEKSKRCGDTTEVECECGEKYDVVADNSVAGWDINFEGEKLPKTFKFKISKKSL
jgi:hypothetical protein